MNAETLAQDVGWDPSGHLSEVALSAAADGENALLDAPMHEHLSSCEECTLRLGEVALRSADVADAFADVRAHAEALASLKAPAAKPVRALARRRMPVLAIAAALAVAMLGAAPSMLAASHQAEETWSVVRKVAPSMARLLPQVIARAWSGSSGPMVVVVWALAAMLVATGFGIAKRASKKALSTLGASDRASASSAPNPGLDGGRQ